MFRFGILLGIVWQLVVVSGYVFASASADPEVIYNQARLLARTWQAAEAIQQYEVAARLFGTTANQESAAMSTLMAAVTAHSSGDQARAKALADDVLSYPVSETSDVKVIAYSLLSLISYQTGKKADAERWSLTARSLITEGASNDALAYSHFSTGIYEYFFHDVRRANEEFENAARLSERSEDAFLSTQALFYSGYSQLRLGNTLPAMNKMQDSLARSQQMGYERGIALGHREIGYIHFYLGERQTALDSFRRSEQMLPDEGTLVERARVRNAIGLVYRDFGDLGSAERYFDDAERAFEAADYPLGSLTALLNRADLYTRSGETERARQAFVLARQRAEHMGDEFQVSLAAEGLGKLELYSKNFERAIALFKEALALTAKSGTDSNTTSELLGAAYELSGDLEKARAQYDSVLAINDRMDNSVYKAKNLYDLARLDYLEGNFEASHARILESVLLTEKVYAWVDSSTLRQAYLGQSYHRFRLMTALSAREAKLSGRPEDIEKSLVYSEKTRSRSLSEGLNFAGAGFTADANESLASIERHLLVSLTAKTDLLINERIKDRAAAATKALEGEISRISEELDIVRTTQKQQSPVYSSLRDPAAFDLASVQEEVLGENDLLIEFFLDKSGSFIWLVDRTRVELHPLPPSESIERMVDSLAQNLQTRAATGQLNFSERAERVRIADSEFATIARGLSDMILGPVAEKIKGKRLIVVADGKLNYFPISALPMPGSGSDDPILLTNEVIYQPSAQTYALLKKIGQERKGERSKDLLVFSDPVFNPADERLTGVEVAAEKSDEPYRFRLVESFSSLSRLPASKTEAETVSKAVGGSDIFMGFDATRERLLSTNLADYKVVHLATHGFLDPERPELSSLVLSRYDQAGKQIDESIRMHDIYSMKLNADLVVLSACQTGTGKEIKGEGVMGLNTAFLQSGARSVVSTLWQVEDNAANELMKEFYRRMVDEGMSPSAALRAAQIKLYQDPQFRSPFFWAAFTVHGDAATSTPFERDNTRLTIALSALAVLSLAAFFFFRRSYRTSKV